MRLYPLRLWSENSNFNFISLGRISYILSIILILLSVVFLAKYRLNFGIDFTGGINIEIKVKKEITALDLRQKLGSLNLGEVVIQGIGQQEFSIKVASDNSAQEAVEKVKNYLSQDIGQDFIEYRKVDFVGPQVGRQLIFDGAQSIFFAFLAIMAYIWFRFEWQFGLGVVIALVHDAILCLGFMSASGLDFNLASIAAILTVIGYSVNDSVVIYDRIRENIRKYRQKNIPEIINISINETLSRTTLTVLTTLIANAALIFFGGEALRSFSVLVFCGIIIGTYSSIFISAPILTFFKLEKFK